MEESLVGHGKELVKSTTLDPFPVFGLFSSIVRYNHSLVNNEQDSWLKCNSITVPEYIIAFLYTKT